MSVGEACGRYPGKAFNRFAAEQRSRRRELERRNIVTRFKDFLAAKGYVPTSLGKICAAIGVPERKLRACCQEELGMSPFQHLWLRRMCLAREALQTADPSIRTVTEIATEYGFWELGRFSVNYRSLFGEPPSVTLRR